MSYEQINEIKQIVIEHFVSMLKNDEKISKDLEIISEIENKAKEYIGSSNTNRAIKSMEIKESILKEI